MQALGVDRLVHRNQFPPMGIPWEKVRLMSVLPPPHGHVCFRSASNLSWMKKCLPRGMERILLGPAHVGPGTGIDLDDFPLLDEEWNLDVLAGFQHGRLHHIATRIPLKSFGGFRHLEIG